MKNVFLFPGQGSQYVGMGKDFYDNYAEAKKIYDLANKVAEMDVKGLCFEASEEELKNTQNAQICIATTSLAILSVLSSKNIHADYASGLSLGEYVALVYGGFLKIEDCFKLLKMRGYYMQNLLPKEEFAMCAIIGLDSKKIEEVCTSLRNEGYFIVPANYNYQAQTVVSGNKKAIEIANSLFKEAGAKRVIELNTSGPFHTEKLNEASKEYKKDLQKIEFLNGNNIKVIKNIDGTFYTASDNFVDILSKHITSPVRFDKALKVFSESNIDNYIEVGPGKAMTGFVKKEIKESNCFAVENIEKFNELVGGMKNE